MLWYPHLLVLTVTVDDEQNRSKQNKTEPEPTTTDRIKTPVSSKVLQTPVQGNTLYVFVDH